MPYHQPIACLHCGGPCARKGKHRDVQLLRCNSCRTYQRSTYRNKACVPGTDARIAALTREGCGIRSIGRVR